MATRNKNKVSKNTGPYPQPVASSSRVDQMSRLEVPRPNPNTRNNRQNAQNAHPTAGVDQALIHRSLQERAAQRPEQLPVTQAAYRASALPAWKVVSMLVPSNLAPAKEMFIRDLGQSLASDDELCRFIHCQFVLFQRERRCGPNHAGQYGAPSHLQQGQPVAHHAQMGHPAGPQLPHQPQHPQHLQPHMQHPPPQPQPQAHRHQMQTPHPQLHSQFQHQYQSQHQPLPQPQPQGPYSQYLQHQSQPPQPEVQHQPQLRLPETLPVPAISQRHTPTPAPVPPAHVPTPAPLFDSSRASASASHTPVPRSGLDQHEVTFDGYRLGVPATAQAIPAISPGTTNTGGPAAGPSSSGHTGTPTKESAPRRIARKRGLHAVTPDLTASLNSPAGPSTGPHTPQVEPVGDATPTQTMQPNPQQILMEAAQQQPEQAVHDVDDDPFGGMFDLRKDWNIEGITDLEGFDFEQAFAT